MEAKNRVDVDKMLPAGFFPFSVKNNEIINELKKRIFGFHCPILNLPHFHLYIFTTIHLSRILTSMLA